MVFAMNAELRHAVANPNGMRKALQAIAEDCVEDAKKLDGQPVNGHVLATQFGQQLAMIGALANINLVLLDRIDKLEQAQRTGI